MRPLSSHPHRYIHPQLTIAMTPLSKILYLAALDDSDEPALRRAVALAESNQASLTIATVLSIPPGYNLLAKTHLGFQKLMESERERFSELLEFKREQLKSSTDLEIHTEVFAGKMNLEVVRQVVRNGYDMVIKPSESPEVSNKTMFLFGSADINLMRNCPCPVLIVKPHWTGDFKSIIAAVDRDEEAPENHLLNLRILKLASWLAIADSAELHVLHYWRMPFDSLLRSPRSIFTDEEVDQMEQEEKLDREKWIQELISDFSGRHPKEMEYLQPRLYALQGYASRDIPMMARELDADLIVMGTVGRVGVKGLLMGNTSETILQKVECSGLTVKPPGFESSISA